MDSVMLLAALQHADSFFPGGTASFSWGLETLRTDGLIRTADQVEVFVAGQLRHRWACADRPLLAAAYDAADDLDAVSTVDHLQEAMALAAELREGSRRMGSALLGVHTRLGTRNAEAYHVWVLAGRVPGHIAVVQGLVWHGVGLSREIALAIAAHGFCVGLIGAALRLGLIGYLDGQRSLTALRDVVAEALAAPIPGLGEISSFVPACDIALMRHETQTARLFAN
jgi:urease accessory protein